MVVFWIPIYIFDCFYKLFQYAWFIVVPIIFLIFYLIIKRLKTSDEKDKDKISRIIYFLILSIFIAASTVRIWGVSFYKVQIGRYICGQEKNIEQKLEKKYDRNFTFISESKIKTKDFVGEGLGEDVSNDYYVRYFFKDDEGVFSIVDYYKDYGIDWYESKRSKYEIEKTIYEYAKKINFNRKFFVYAYSDYESINYSYLDDHAVFDKEMQNRVEFFFTEESRENEDFMNNSLKHYKYSISEDMIVFTEEEYAKVVSFFESLNTQPGIAGKDYEEHYDFNRDNVIYTTYLYY